MADGSAVTGAGSCANSGVSRGAESAALATRDGRDVRARASADAVNSPSNPESLVREIERTRSELARTVDAIAERVSPSHAARRAVDRMRDEAARANPPLVGAVVAGVVVVGAMAFFAWRRRRLTRRGDLPGEPPR